VEKDCETAPGKNAILNGGETILFLSLSSIARVKPLSQLESSILLPPFVDRRTNNIFGVRAHVVSERLWIRGVGHFVILFSTPESEYVSSSTEKE